MPKLSQLTSKATPNTADEVVITDKADSDNTKRATLNSLPISSAQASVNSAKAPLASPTFTGTVTVPTLNVSAISGQAPFADGSAAAPSITNTGDTNTGFFFPSADSVGCTVAGSLAWTTDSSGSVLVGKSTADFAATSGVELLQNGFFAACRDSNLAARFNRNGSTGDIIEIRYNNLAKGSIAVTSSLVQLHGSGGGGLAVDGSSNVLVGKSASSGATEGVEFRPAGQVLATRDSGVAGFFRRDTSTGDLIEFNYNGIEVGTVEIDSAASVAYRTSSDYRLKENVIPLTGAIERLKQLKPSRFNWISDPSRTVDGFIAHEAQEVVPEAVSKSKDAMKTVVIQEAVEAQPAVFWTEEDELPEGVSVGDVKTEAVEAVPEVTEEQPDYQGIDQSKIVPLLTSALQEALAKIDTLEARITALEAN